jgi:hypothetical protein
MINSTELRGVDVKVTVIGALPSVAGASDYHEALLKWGLCCDVEAEALTCCHLPSSFRCGLPYSSASFYTSIPPIILLALALASRGLELGSVFRECPTCLSAISAGASAQPARRKGGGGSSFI